MDADAPPTGFTLLRPLGVLFLVVGGAPILFATVGALLVRCEPSPCTPDFWFYPHLAALGIALLLGDYIGRNRVGWD